MPLPNLIEQQAIVERLEDIFSRIDTLASWCATELARSATLRQSILKAAFSGTLVPQDPIDEPASALLERIQIAHQSPSLSRLTGHTSTKTTQPTLWEPT